MKPGHNENCKEPKGFTLSSALLWEFLLQWIQDLGTQSTDSLGIPFNKKKYIIKIKNIADTYFNQKRDNSELRFMPKSTSP